MVSWYFFNKAHQAIWVGDFTRAREFLEKTIEVFAQENDLEITNNLPPNTEWDEIIHEAIKKDHNRHQRKKSRVDAFDHISATISACHYLIKRVRVAEHYHRADSDSRIIQENMNVFLVACPAGKTYMLIKGYSPSNKLPHFKRVHEHLEHFEREFRNDRVSYTINESGSWLSCVVHRLQLSYIGTVTVFFAPWFLIQGSITYGSLNANNGLKRAALDFLKFLAYILTD